MNIIGKWNFKAIETIDFENNGVKIYTKEELLTSTNEDIQEFAMMAESYYLFKENGDIEMWFKIPDGINIDELPEDERPSKIEGNYFLSEDKKMTWKEKDGKIYAIGGYENEGKPAEDEIVVFEDGSIKLKTFIFNIILEK